MNYQDRIPVQAHHQRPWVNSYAEQKADEYDKNGRKLKPKNFGVAVILLITLWFVAAERFYLGHHKYAICKIAIILTALVAIVVFANTGSSLPQILILFVGGWIVYDFLRVLKRRVNNVNWDDRP